MDNQQSVTVERKRPGAMMLIVDEKWEGQSTTHDTRLVVIIFDIMLGFMIYFVEESHDKKI